MEKFDGNDALAVLGASLVLAGLAMIYFPLAPLALGLVLTWLGVS